MDFSPLQQIITTLVRVEDVAELQAVIADAVCQALQAEACSMVVLDSEGNKAALSCRLSRPGQHTYRALLAEEAGLVDTCLRTGRRFYTHNAPAEPGFNPAADGPEGIAPHTLLCLPVQGETACLGAIAVYNKPGGFSDQDQQLAETIASLAANSLNTIYLVRQLKIANADLQASRWELLRSRNTLRALFDNIPLSFYIVDQSFTLLAINISRAERAEKTPVQLVGKPCYKALFDRNDPCPECEVSRTLFSGQSTFRILRHWELENEPQEWEINTYPIQDENGQTIQAILLEQDVTEKRRLEAKLIQSEKLAAVGQLAAGLAHEINNPLTAIIANAQLIQRDPGLDADLRESIELIEVAGARAGQVVRNLLDLSRRDQYQYVQIDLLENIQKAVNLLQYELVSRDINLSIEKDREIPGLLASPEHLEGVWINLISNAIDAIGSAPGGKIWIRLHVNKGEVRVTVADNGHGIPSERIDRIFEPFYTTKASGHGTGLGLAVCQRIIKQHGGFIQVNSRHGVGTEFHVTLPLS
jgi:signal transduction histidine kinase